MEYSFYIDVVAEHGARIADVARAGQFDGRVPHKPEWRLIDVVAHLGVVHRWAARVVSTREWTGPGHRTADETGHALIDWFEVGLAELVAVLSRTEPALSWPNFSLSPRSSQTVGFWARRQANESVLRRWDAESVTDRCSPMEPTLATDGIDEMLNVLRRSHGQKVDAPIGLITTDTDARWRVSPACHHSMLRITSGNDALDGVAATVAAPAEALFLAVGRRRSIDDGGFQVVGRHELAHAFLPGPGRP